MQLRGPRVFFVHTIDPMQILQANDFLHCNTIDIEMNSNGVAQDDYVTDYLINKI